jgi:sigma-E factor negative regulatory protein RseB
MEPSPRPAVAGPRPGTEPAALWCITAAVLAGLIVTGITVVARAGAGHGGASAVGRAAHDPAPAGPAAAHSRAVGEGASAAGLKLLGRAALACQTVPFHGVEVLDWQGMVGQGAAVVDVWHATGTPPLMRTALQLPDLPGGIHHIVPPGDTDVAAGPDDDGMLGMSSRLVGLLGINYRLTPEGFGRVAGRTAWLVTANRAGGGLAAKFWLDKATYLPLRRQTFDPAGHVVSDVSFSRLSFGRTAAARLPGPGAKPWGDVLASPQLTQLRGRGWPLPGPLPGNLTLLGARESLTSAGPVIDLDYSDGLSAVSVFMQRGHLPPHLKGWGEVTLRGHEIYADYADGHSLAWSARGFVYTVIAEAPRQTVGQVISALPHDSPPGVVARIRQGMRRLTTWLRF